MCSDFWLSLIFRLGCFALVSTWFVPDEYFQCTEIAYNRVYGKGRLTWEWAGENPLRSVLHPGFVAVFYWLSKVVHVDSLYVVRYLPAILHSILFAVGDVFVVKLFKRLLVAQPRAESIAKTLYYANWFIIYCSPRTLANSVELVLTFIALQWYPFHDEDLARSTRHRTSFLPYIVLGTINIIIRPTAIIVFAILGLAHLWRSQEKLKLMLTAIFGVSVTFAATVWIDHFVQQKSGIPIVEFAKFNFFSNNSARFGVHPLLWYLYDGLLVTTTGLYVPALFGLFYTLQHREQYQLTPKILCVIGFVFIVIHSCLPHKEHRFVLPVIPMVLPFAAIFFDRLLNEFPRFTKFTLIIVVCLNLLLAAFIGVVHQRGNLDAAAEIATDISIKKSETPNVIFALMPCHSLPEYAFFHGLNVEIHSLDCTPDFQADVGTPSMDDSTQFHQHPVDFYRLRLQPLANKASDAYAVVYEKTYRVIASELKSDGFRPWRTFAHTPFPVSSNDDQQVFVLKKSS